MRGFELLLVIVVGASIVLGVSWGKSALPSPTTPLQAWQVPQAQPRAAGTLEAFAAQHPLPTLDAALSQPISPPIENTAIPGTLDAAVVKTPMPFNVDMSGVEEGDAPLIEQAPSTLNFLLLGTDASADQKYARTDSVMIASVNPDFPSVSLLSFPRDLIVKIPGFGSDRINTVFERGYIANYPGGGPGFLGLVLRKNFGIRIDHFVRIDFQGFIKAIDTLGGVDVLAECELHDTFPDKAAPNGKTDLDVYPGRVTLSGKQALWFSRSRWSTTDFDRARRQQKVIRAVIKKARNANMLQNAISLYGDFRNYLETDIGITDLPKFIEIAQRLGDLQMKSRVITFGIVRAYSRPSDGASVLLPTDKTIPFIKEALSPPSGNQAQVLPVVEVYNGGAKANMEYVAAERLAWEGFNVVAVDKMPVPEFKENQLVVYTTSSKGSPIPRLAQIFNVKQKNVINELDPSSASAARIVLGENYNSCPATASMGQDVTLQTEQEKLLPTPTVGVAGKAAP